MMPIIGMSLLESMRRQIHLITLFLACILLVEPAMTSAFNMGTPDRVIKDLGFTLMGLYGVGLTLFLSCSAVPGEIERFTIYPILARPVSRLSYLTAKFLSIAIILAVSQIILGTCVFASLVIFLKISDPRIYLVVGAIILEDLVLASAGIFFSTLASPVLAAVLGVFIYIVGGLSPIFISFFLVREASHVTATLAETLKMLMPQFDFFEIKDAIVHNDPIPSSYLPAVFAYGMAWISMALLLAGISFERRDL